MLDGKSQRPDARAEIVRFSADSKRKWTGAVIDLSPAYPQVQRALRGVAMIEEGQMLVQDEISAREPVASIWQMLTDARIKIDGKVATLTKGKRRLTATLLAPTSGHWEVEEVVVPPP